METLRCRRPEMAREELSVYLLDYNLIRLLMAQAALMADQGRPAERHLGPQGRVRRGRRTAHPPQFGQISGMLQRHA
jgi:hypothetical protein